jgi:hypothetical protein
LKIANSPVVEVWWGGELTDALLAGAAWLGVAACVPENGTIAWPSGRIAPPSSPSRRSASLLPRRTNLIDGPLLPRFAQVPSFRDEAMLPFNCACSQNR